MTRIGGVVLCGGQSTRMGRPKAWLPIGNELMLPRVVRLLSEAVSPVVVVAALGQDLPSLPYQTEIICDAKPGRGPLQGLSAGLNALLEAGPTLPTFLHVMFRFCNLPSFAASSICYVISPFVYRRSAAIATLWRRCIASKPPRSRRSLLAEDRLRPAFLFDEMPTRIVQPEELADVDPTFQSLRNVNTPAEYEAALRESFHSKGGLR